MRYYTDNVLNRRLKRVGLPIPSKKGTPRNERVDRNVLRRGNKIKVNLLYGKRVIASYRGLDENKLVILYRDKEYKLDPKVANLEKL